jgi:glycosyltransferase involved in cell wall biosynthesis
MRVAYVCADYGIPVFGCAGGAIHVQEVVRVLLALGCRVELYAAAIQGTPAADLASVGVHELRPWRTADEGANQQLAATLAAAGPFDLVYERYSLWSCGAMEHARRVGVPGVLEVNAPLIEESMTYRKPIDGDAAAGIRARVFAAASLVAVVSRELVPYVEQHAPAAGRVHVVPNAINPRRFPGDVPATHPAAPGVFTVGFVGSMKAWHGLPTLVAAFAELHRRDPASRLLLVGDGPERGRTEAALTACGVREATLFTGAVPPDAVPGLLASMDVAVAPSPDLPMFYFSPLKVFEYMAAGLPVVASRVGQLREVLAGEGRGVLCPPGDVTALVDALDRLRRDRLRRERLGRAARAYVLAHYTWDANVQRILRLTTATAPSSVARAGAQLGTRV